ncbi:uncharacterized protein C8Q71DRAFT_853711 [Rhodofomes roseus]|uniref:Uncharacterized protein n=1 Tax=Rhodofomes roseus TaxID=34475 RepID=A0ABQ8KWM2_9APHY|nr:uncharacterized protein C8Q71DRAFT_853711 [Rhodofomes roseus]KAH9843226.1 hypothetical protein C8Q71DRAFT_853711 [Rhodofomes roseus]
MQVYDLRPPVTSLLPDSRGTSHYIFRGRPKGQIDQILDDGDKRTQSRQQLLDELEELHRHAEGYEQMMHDLDVALEDKTAMIASLNAELIDAQSKIVAHDLVLQNHIHDVNVTRLERDDLQKANSKLMSDLGSTKEVIRDLKKRLSANRGVQATPGGALSGTASPSTSAQPHLSVQGATSTAASELGSRYARGFGHAVQEVIENHHLDYLVHNTCEKVAGSSAALVWPRLLAGELMTQFHVVAEDCGAIALELSDAMQADLQGTGR